VEAGDGHVEAMGLDQPGDVVDSLRHRLVHGGVAGVAGGRGDVGRQPQDAGEVLDGAGG